MFNKLECIVLDLDKSLLSKDGRISERDILTINKLIENGIYVFLATGRHFNVAKYYGYLLKLKTPIICADGSMIYDIYRNTLIYCDCLNNEQGKLIWEWIQHNSRHKYNIYTDKRLVGNTIEFIDLYWHEAMYKDKSLLQDSVIMDSSFVEVVDERIIKVVLYDWTEEVIDDLERIFNDFEDIEIKAEDKFTLEIKKPNNSKYTAVKDMSRYYGFSLMNTLALGDNQNDFDLLRGVGWPIVPESAEFKYKRLAKFITSNSNNSPLTKCIKSLFPQYFM